MAVPVLWGQKSGVGEINCTVCYLHRFPLALESSLLRQPSGPWSPNPPWPRAVQVVIQRVASGKRLLLRAPGCAEPSRQLPPHGRCRSPAWAGGLLPCPALREGGQTGPPPFPAPLSPSTGKPSSSPSGARGRQSQAGSEISRQASVLWARSGGQSWSPTDPWQGGLESAGREGLQPPKTPLFLARAKQQICDSFVTGKAQPYVI